MGSTIGNYEFESQTNQNANCVPEEDRFKFVNDLSILEIINLLNIGLSSHNTRQQVRNDIPTHGQIIPSSHLMSQEYINKIQKWTEDQEMIISEKKTKSMIINFTRQYQFHARLQLKGENIEVVDKIKILGTTLTNCLSWTDNCDIIVKKVNARMQLLRKVSSFGSSQDEMVHLWKVFCLSVLDQSCVVWGSGLTKENENDLERTQKTFAKLVLEENYITYYEALKTLQLDPLKLRREKFSLSFIIRSLANGKLRDLFQKAHTERLKKSPILAMQRLFNENT